MISIFRDVRRLTPLLSADDKSKTLLLFGLMFVAAVLEAVGIALVPAFVSVVVSPEKLIALPLIGQWFDGLPDYPLAQFVFWASVFLVTFILFKNLFLLGVYYLQSSIVTGLRARLSDRMFAVYQKAPLEWHMRRNTSELLRNIKDDIFEVVFNVLMPFMDLMMGLIMTGVIIAVLVFGTPWPALFGIMITGAGLYAVIRMFRNRLRHYGLVTRQEYNEINKSVQQGFGALVDARIAGREPYFRRLHDDAHDRLARAHRGLYTIQKWTPYAIETFAVIGLLGLLVLLIATTERIESVLPVFALLAVAILRLKQFATRIATAVNKINGGRAFIPNILADLDELSTIEQASRETGGRNGMSREFGSLSLDDVHYRYPGSESDAVSGVSLQIERGESVGFVGSTGCGKSTLINVVLGLLEPLSGTVNLNGTDIRRGLQHWQSMVGYIPQSIYLIDDSIRANIAFGLDRDQVDDDALAAAIRSARLEAMIGDLPDGLETVVGERGVRLSGGQRQRIGIARAMYRRPEVIVMDESTSALDNRTEAEVMYEIQELKQQATLVIIAHRLTTVQGCDRIYFLDQGRIVNVGSYEDLKETSQAFREMASNNA